MDRCTGGAKLSLGAAFTATVTDRNAADDVNDDGSTNTEAMRAELLFENGEAQGFRFEADTFEMKFGASGFLVLGAEYFILDTTASGDEALVSFGMAKAVVNVGGFQVGGEARNFYITADGSFKAGSPDNPNAQFTVLLNIGGADGSNFKWPDFIPIKIKTIGLQWEDIEANPLDFNIMLSASVSSIKGVPNLKVSGVVEGIIIDPDLLFDGNFPVIDIASISISISGNMFAVKLLVV